MHELSLAESLADLVEERTVGRSVVTVHLRVGRDAGVMADAMAFCWDVVTTSSPLEGARLEIEEVTGDELALASVELMKEGLDTPSLVPRGGYSTNGGGGGLDTPSLVPREGYSTNDVAGRVASVVTHDDVVGRVASVATHDDVAGRVASAASVSRPTGGKEESCVAPADAVSRARSC